MWDPSKKWKSELILHIGCPSSHVNISGKQHYKTPRCNDLIFSTTLIKNNEPLMDGLTDTPEFIGPFWQGMGE